MLLACAEPTYNEFKCFGASALGFLQTEKWVSMKIIIQQGGDAEAATWDWIWDPSRPGAGTTSRHFAHLKQGQPLHKYM